MWFFAVYSGYSWLNAVIYAAKLRPRNQTIHSHWVDQYLESKTLKKTPTGSMNIQYINIILTITIQTNIY